MLILSTVIGLLGSAMPDLIGLFRNRQDNAQELAILRLQTEREAAGHSFRMDEISAEADIREIEALHQEFANRKATWKWIEALISSVRPVVTYGFVAMYSSVKASQVVLAFRSTGQDIFLALPAVWSEWDQAIFATIIAFWFGQRSLQKFRKGA
jgi:dTDP-4-amino-4,6-dideoxygalactose transaminase